MRALISTFLISFFFIPSGKAQIKIPGIFSNRNTTEKVTVEWNCPVPDVAGVEKLPVQNTVKIEKKGDKIKIRPNIFGKNVLSGSFLKKTFNSIVRPNDERYLYDYKDCLENFYQEVAKEADEDFVNSLKEEVAQSDYFKDDKDKKIFVPTLRVGTDNATEEEVQKAYKAYCENGQNEFPSALLSKAFTSKLEKEASIYNYKFNYSLSCIDKIKKHFLNYSSEFEKEFCSEVPEDICADYKEKTKNTLDTYTRLTDSYKNRVLAYEEKLKGLLDNVYISDEEKEKWRQKFNSEDSCDLQHTRFRADTSIDFDQILSENLDKIFETGDHKCLSMMMQNYLVGRALALGQTSFVRNFCQTTQTPKCEKLEEQKILVLDNYSRMFSKLYGKTGEELFNTDIACRIDQEDPLSSLLNNINENKEIINCLPLKVGDSKSGNFTVKRTDDKSYDILLNLTFAGGGAADKASVMEERVRKCAQDVSPYLKGPNGEKLNLKVLNAKELEAIPAIDRPRNKNIKVERAGFRSNSGAYEENIGCAVITHELLHLLGLADEYRETQYASTGNYACRVVPKVASIMKNHNEAFARGVGKVATCTCFNDNCKRVLQSGDKKLQDIFTGADIFQITDHEFRTKYCKSKDLYNFVNYDTMTEEEKRSVFITEESETSLVAKGHYLSSEFPKFTQVVLSCSCEAEDTECLQGLEREKEAIRSSVNLKRQYCPAGSRRDAVDIGKLAGDEKMQVVNENQFKIASEPSWNSLLHPAHFDVILNGSCSKQGKIYKECSRYSYSSDPENCEKVPKECHDDSYYLGISKE